MALFQPTNISPSTLGGIGHGTIDVTKPVTISWQVNGNSPMVAYRIRIMKNDEGSTQMMDTGRVALSTPFWGTNSKGEVQLFSIVIPSGTFLSNGIVNGYANGYKMEITQWWSTTEHIVQTSDSYFITRTAPNAVLQSILYPTSFRYVEYTFETYYWQDQGDALEWNRWELQVKNGDEYITVDDTGNIYNAALNIHNGHYGINYTYNGFIIGKSGDTELAQYGTEYRIKCTVQTVNGVQADTGWNTFYTQNIGSNYLRDLSLCAQSEHDAVRIELPENFAIAGNATGTYSYLGSESSGYYAVSLSSGASVQWGDAVDNIKGVLNGNYSIIVRMDITSVPSSEKTIFSAEYSDGQLVFSYSGSGFYLRNRGTIIWQNSVAPVSNAQITICITNENVFFGKNVNGTITKSKTAIANWQNSDLYFLKIYGPGAFRFVWIENTTWRDSDFDYVVSVTGYNPLYTEETMFLAVFNGTLYTGSDNMSSQIAAFAIYKKARSAPIFKYVAKLPLNEAAHTTAIYDYSALSQETYDYYLLYMREDSYVETRGFITTIRPCFWNYTVLCCSTDTEGNYIVEDEYRFALNVESGSMSNNNKPTIQQNFTPYPIRQPVNLNYRSGTLTALIGKVSNNNYTDSTQLMKELYALSTSPLTKFLKTRKGEIFQIEVSSPITMKISDKYVQQPAKISLSWVEVADASNANILETALMGGMPRFTVDPTTMELTMQYSEYSMMGQDSFSLVNADLYINNSGTYDFDDFSINSDNEVIFNPQ